MAGRAIRHANDWSAIILFDARFASPSSQALLPRWISDGIQTAPTFGLALRNLAAFQKARRAVKSS